MSERDEFFYSVGEGSDRHECRGTHHLPRPREARDAAEEAAEDYAGNHDGLDASWPLLFVLYESEDGPEVARYLVHMSTFVSQSFCAVAPAPGKQGEA